MGIHVGANNECNNPIVYPFLPIMTKFNCLLTTVILCCTGLLAAQTPTVYQSVTIDSTWNLINTDSFSIQSPPKWEIDQTGRLGTTVILMSPPESPDDRFRENFNLAVQNLGSRKITLDQFTTLSEKQIKQFVKDGAVVESKRMGTGDNAYHKIIYTGKQGVLLLQFEQYYKIVGNKAYVLTFTTEQFKFDDFKAVGETIMGSLWIKK
jgi:hypothetical protein